MVCAWDRIEAHAAARKLAAIAELGRRNPGPLDEEFTADQLGCALGETRARAHALLAAASHLDTHLPGTRAALDDGTLSMGKAQIIANATGLLDPAEARAAEAEVLDRAARLTPPGLRAAIARAVMEVAPKKAKERREQAAKDARVERWIEDSGNAALMGRELPPAEVLAADQRITAWAKELGTAGLEGDMDQLRARAYLDLLLAKDSRPRRPATAGGDGGAASDSPDNGPGGAGGPGGGPGPAGPDEPGRSPAGPAGGAVPAGFAGRVTLTAPLATLARLADRPGELGGLGPIDPWLARDLAAAAAHNPKTTWCVTVTDAKGHAVAHGCARPEPKSHANRAGPGPPGRDRASPSPRPAGTARRAGTAPGGCAHRDPDPT